MCWCLIEVANWLAVLMAEPTVLILGGTSLGIALAREITCPAVYSLAGRTTPKSLPVVDVRVGGFGGVDALAEYLQANSIRAVIDATHAYAAQITANAVEACDRKKIPLLRLEETAWQQLDGDIWHDVADLEEAKTKVASIGRRVLVSTGRQSIPAFVDDARCHWLLRLIPTTDGLPELASGEYLFARGPFDVEDERSLLREEKIDAIISKNAGSQATRPKLDAARELNLPVIMIARPEASSQIKPVASVEEAMNWLENLET
jgi:precorrin-6A/cobalt-precorrin-6A reductase